MKYLKTYEDWPASDGEETIEMIDDWMKNNKILNVYFTPAIKGYEFVETREKSRPIKIKKIYFIPEEDDEIYGHGATWGRDENDYIIELETLTDDTLQEILDYLNSLTEDEIIEIHSKQESEKFNF